MEQKVTDKIDSNSNYENEKQELIDSAVEKFGNEYFNYLDILIKDNEPELEPNRFKYTLRIDYKGAFHASQERYSK